LDQIDIAFKDANIKLGNAVSQFLGLSEAVKSAKQAFTIFAEAMTIALTPDADPLMSEITRVQNQIALLEKQASELQPEIIPRITIDFGQDNGLDDAIREIPDLAELEVIAAGGTEVDKLKEKLAQLNMQLFRRAEAESLANLEAFKTAQEDKKRAEEKAAIIAAEKARLDLMRKIRDAEAESMKQLAEFMKQQKQAQDSLISSNESALSSENALRLQYSRNRDTIAELNEILKRTYTANNTRSNSPKQYNTSSDKVRLTVIRHISKDSSCIKRKQTRKRKLIKRSISTRDANVIRAVPDRRKQSTDAWIQ
jgi:hypothetical protein